MILRFLRWLFTPSPKAAPVEVLAPLERPPSFFTSDMEDAEGASRDLVLAAAQRRSVPVQPEHFRIVNAAGVAMDGAGDSFSSSAKAAFAMHGGNMPDAQLLWYSSQGFIGFQMCAILSQQWLVQKACDVPARDAIRNGYKITVNDGVEVPPDVLARLEKADKRHKVKAQCRELVRNARIFGIRIALFRVESTDPLYYERPFNPDGITPGSYKGIVQIDPYWVMPELSMVGASEPTSPDFYEPTFWTIRGKRYHRSHLVIARGPEVPDLLKPTYQFAGVSIPQRIYERIYAAERTANEGPQLALTKRAMIFYTDTQKALANQSKFEDRLSTWTHYRDNYGVKVADKDGDKIEQHDTALGDFDQTVMTQYQLVAAIANVPATKLLGTTPKGFNSSGDYEQDSYHEELEAIQSNDMEPLIARHHLCVIRSEQLGAFSVAVEWEPTDTPDAKEEAEIRKLEADTAKVYSDAGAVDGQDIRDKLIADPKSGYNGMQPIAPEPPPEPVALPLPPPGGAQPGNGLDAAEWDALTGTYAEAVIITQQSFLDEAVVAEKIAAQDFLVELSPEFQTAAGKRYRVLIDGHHRLAAAVRSGNTPVFVESNYSGSDFRNAVTKLPAFVELAAA